MANNKWLGRDGKYYDDLLSKNLADRQVDLQEKQLSELQRQNALKQQELFAQQQNAENERRERAFQQENQRKHERELAQQQFNHDQEMRILGLFDSVGLNKSYYDKFINYLLGGVIDYNDVKNRLINDNDYMEEKLNILKELLPDPAKNIKKMQQELKKYNEKSNLNKVDSEKKDALEDKLFIIEDLFGDCYSINDELKEKYNDVINNFRNIDSIEDDEVLNPENSDIIFAKKYLYTFYFLIVVSIIVIVICFSGMIESSSEWLILFFFLGLGSSCLLIYLCYKTRINAISEIQEILSLEDRFKYLDSKKVNDKAQKLNKEFQQKVVDNKHKLDNMEKEISQNVLPKWNDFIEFRKKHYISQFENLLLDLKLPEMIQSLGLEYPKINNKNKIKNGSIEDYITYFDELG